MKKIITEAITFDEFIKYGEDNGGNMVAGMPWSFEYKGHAVTHEHNRCYLIPGRDAEMNHFTPSDLLVTCSDGELYPINEVLYNKLLGKI